MQCVSQTIHHAEDADTYTVITMKHDEETDNQQFNYKKELVEELLNETGSHESSQIQYNADGTVSHACDCTSGGKTQEEKIKNQCDCEGFSDEPYEPDWDSMNEDLD